MSNRIKIKLSRSCRFCGAHWEIGCPHWEAAHDYASRINRRGNPISVFQVMDTLHTLSKKHTSIKEYMEGTC